MTTPRSISLNGMSRSEARRAIAQFMDDALADLVRESAATFVVEDEAACDPQTFQVFLNNARVQQVHALSSALLDVERMLDAAGFTEES